MNTRFTRSAVTGVMALGLLLPLAATAEDEGKGCTFDGTWYGVEAPDDLRLTGWMNSMSGKSANKGIAALEFPTFDHKLFGLYPEAEYFSAMRGTWVRTSGNSFAYTMIGMATAADGITPVWIGKIYGNSTLSDDCSTETITG